jgi:hypothetical protein
MRKAAIPVRCLVVILGLAVIREGFSQSLNVFNPGFEETGKNGLPAGWSVSDLEEMGSSSIVLDREAAHSGSASLKVSHTAWNRSVLISKPVSLETGHLYRLSGWMKTREAVSNPAERYPTPVPACLTMESFPFTNHSPSVGADREWTRVEVLFFATRSTDRVRVHLGHNGGAAGTVWFDDIRLDKVEDISEAIPLETVEWFGPAFRYRDRGWIYVHIEGKAYQRGYQYGYLLADEISAYTDKLAIRANQDDPRSGWEQTRFITDAIMLRKYDEEYLLEMRGIADGAARAGAEFRGRKVDFLDVVTLNSVIDLGQMRSALRSTAHPLSGRSFLSEEEELYLPDELGKCSGFLANGPASADGRIVFGQIFMWNGYTGVHWNVICDLVPEKGHRLVFETFPGGIHSGADFYINSSGIMIGETTVMQTPFDLEGTPQSNRIRKAAQYAGSIDDVEKILMRGNNGMYTNDWLIGDTKSDETAIFLLGTKKSRLWRSRSGEFPGGTKGFYFSTNNNKDPDVRKEYIPGPDNAPFDLAYRPSNRDIAFNRFYHQYKGRFDSNVGARIWASSPINRPHACDGKITTSEMAEKMMFFAHAGKVTLREKFVGENGRIPELPGAEPRLSLGYSVFSPLFVAEKLKECRNAGENSLDESDNVRDDFSGVKDIYSYSRKALWSNTVYPESDAENWFVSGSAAYWRMLRYLPSEVRKAAPNLQNNLADNGNRLLYTISREGAMAPLEARRLYDRANHYQIPRIRGTFLLHQLRLLLGNDLFSRLMNTVHSRFRDKSMTTNQFISVAEKEAGRSLEPFILQWLERTDLPDPRFEARVSEDSAGWRVDVIVRQDSLPYHFVTTLAIETGQGRQWHRIETDKARRELSFSCDAQPGEVRFNAGCDIPVPRENFYSLSNFYDDFHRLLVVYGTARQIEAHHTLALRYSKVLADRYAEILPPVRKDCEVTEEETLEKDLILLANSRDNGLLNRLAETWGFTLGNNWFQWQNKTWSGPDEGIFLTLPNPEAPERIVYCIIANSALQLYRMTRYFRSLPGWAVMKGERIVKSGYHPKDSFLVRF